MFVLKQAKERVFMLAFLTVCAHLQLSHTRSLWVRERSGHWWEQVAANFGPQDWLQNFRMSHATFLYLCDSLKSAIQRRDTTMRRAIGTEKRLGIAILHYGF